MYEQLDMFSFLNGTHEKDDKFCWDNDINEIYNSLVKLTDSHELAAGEPEWSIWEHVPQYGYRMTFVIKIRRSDYTQDFLDELNEIVEFAKARKVELSPMAPHFYHDDEMTEMYIFSTFMDKERQNKRRVII